MSWHQAYVDNVLEPDYRFAAQYLQNHLLDALVAHVQTVARLPAVAQDPAAVQDCDDLIRELRTMYGQQLPPRTDNVPDAYFAVNQELDKRLGAAKVSRLRTGLSRNDLDMTIYKLATRQRLLEAGELLDRLRQAVLDQAERHTRTVVIARTHHQPGQPTTVAHYLSGILSMLERDAARLRQALERLDTSPLGAAALAGSSHPLDRQFTAAALGFREPVANTYDAVSASDWQLDAAAVTTSLSVNMSRFIHDLLEWATRGIYRLGDSLVQGSSIMPQKRNPVSLEHARTRFSRALGTAQQVVFSSHNIPYGDYNDFGPDVQGALRQQHILLAGGLNLLIACLQDAEFVLPVLAREASLTDTTATELADELVRHHGMAFQDAHAVAARAVAHALSRGVALQQLTNMELQSLGGPELSEAELRDALSPESFTGRRTGYGGPAPEVVAAQLQTVRSNLDRDANLLRETRSNIERAQGALRVPRKEQI